MKKYVWGVALPRAVAVVFFVGALWVFKSFDFGSFLIVR